LCRYSAVVKDNVITHLNVEPDGSGKGLLLPVILRLSTFDLFNLVFKQVFPVSLTELTPCAGLSCSLANVILKQLEE
jgi:hypothetical protein